MSLVVPCNVPVALVGSSSSLPAASVSWTPDPLPGPIAPMGSANTSVTVGQISFDQALGNYLGQPYINTVCYVGSGTSIAIGSPRFTLLIRVDPGEPQVGTASVYMKIATESVAFGVPHVVSAMLKAHAGTTGAAARVFLIQTDAVGQVIGGQRGGFEYQADSATVAPFGAATGNAGVVDAVNRAGWVRLYAGFTFTNVNASACYLILENASVGSGTIDFDGIQLERAADPNVPLPTAYGPHAINIVSPNRTYDLRGNKNYQQW